jgi:hypothetical protein
MSVLSLSKGSAERLPWTRQWGPKEAASFGSLFAVNEACKLGIEISS